MRLLLALNCENDFLSTATIRTFWEFWQHHRNSQEFELPEFTVERSAWDEAGRELQRAQAAGVALLTPFSEQYPASLLEIADPPILLFVRGRMELACAVAVVGARRCSHYGARTAERIGKVLAERGATVVSGLALGVDAAAHRGALSVESLPFAERSPTVAVLGSGVCAIHPRSNAKLADQILADGGAIIGEYGLFREPRRHYYPRRNRIISGLCRRVIVVEADERSGSLITARCALEQGREVAAVPGAIDSRMSKGCNRLLQDGAQVICCPEDAVAGLSELEVVPKDLGNGKTSIAQQLGELLAALGIEQQQRKAAELLLIDLAAEGRLNFDQLSARMSLEPERLVLLLSQLELASLLRLVEGSYQLGEVFDNC